MEIYNYRNDLSFLDQISKMTLARTLSCVEEAFIDGIVCDVKSHKQIERVKFPPSHEKEFNLDPKLIHELVTNVKREISENEEIVLLGFVKALSIQDLQSINNPLLKNYLLILSTSCYALKLIIPNESERIALAYSALHGTPLTQKLLKSCLTAFDITNKEVLEDLQRKSALLP